MKIFIFIFLLSISLVELRLRDNDDDDDDNYELDDLLKKYDRYNHHQNKQYIPDETDDQDFVPPYPIKKEHSSHKKVLNKDEDFEIDEPERIPKKTTHNDINDDDDDDDLPETSLCFNDYNIKSEQLVKVKELKDGANMIRYTVIDKRTLSSKFTVKDHCMLTCCSEKNCDLAMLSEQPTHEGYKCYLFDCNGTCPLASHQDYTVLIPKKDALYYKTSIPVTKMNDIPTTTTSSNVNTLKRKSIFRETSVIIFLVFGIISTLILFVFIFRYCRSSQKRGRKSKNYSVDPDYLIDGLYL